MTQPALQLFINPTAGRGRAGRRLQNLLDIFAAAGLAVDTHSSRDVGDLENKVREATEGGLRQLVVAGGDGSIHEAVNGLMAARTTAAMGVIPTGTGNDFAKAAGIPLDWRRATRELAERLRAGAEPRLIDVGRMNQRYFANGAGIGFDAKVTSIARSYRWPMGDIVYLLAILRCMLDGIATPELVIDAEDFHWREPVTLANVANGPWVGGMFHIAPPADNADGHFDLVIARPVTRRRILRLLPLLMRGRHLAQPDIRHVPVRRVEVTAAAALPSHLDGEVQAPADRFVIEILPGALRLL